MFTSIRKKEVLESGFTLIELLVVILVIGILAAIAIPVFLNQRQKASETSVKSDLTNAGKVFETELASTGKYPTSLPDSIKSSNGVTLTLKASTALPPVSIWTPPATDPRAGSFKIKVRATGQEATIYWRVYSNYVNFSDTASGLTQQVTYGFHESIKCSGSASWVEGGDYTKFPSPGSPQWDGNGVAKCPAGQILESYKIDPQRVLGSNATNTADLQKIEIINVVSEPNNKTTYCISAVHSNNAGNVWKYDPLAGGLQQGSC